MLLTYFQCISRETRCLSRALSRFAAAKLQQINETAKFFADFLHPHTYFLRFTYSERRMLRFFKS